MIELATVFERAQGTRFADAERLVMTWPTLFPPPLLSRCDLGFKTTSSSLFAVAHFEEKSFGPDTELRFQFWAAQCGGRPLSTYLLHEAERQLFRRQFLTCEFKEAGLTPDKLPEVFARLADSAGMSGTRRLSSRMAVELEVDLGANGGKCITRDASENGLFILGTQFPPLGDKFKLKLSIPERKTPFEVDVRVVHARTPATARPKSPAGFGVQFLSPSPDLTHALSEFFKQQATQSELESRRTSVRHAVNAPVKMTAVPPAGESAPGAPLPPLVRPPPPAANVRLAPSPSKPPPAPTALSVEYADIEMAQLDYVKNLSHGGAFIETRSPPPMHTRVKLDFHFPRNLSFQAIGTVVHSHPSGVGVQFALSAADKQSLAGIIDKLTAVPKRALVIEAQAEVRKVLSNALKERGFEVIEALSAESGLNKLLEELLNLDVLLCRQSLEPLNGRPLVEVIRRAGGETDLALVVVADVPGTPTDGVDAVVAGGATAKQVAQAVNDAWERKKGKRPLGD